MSSTFSELAASALVEALAAPPVGGRYLVTSTDGEELANTFRAVLARSEDERTFKPPGASEATLQTISTGDGCVIVPYLVQDLPAPHPRGNRGSQGFVSAMRDNYSDAGAPGERIVLLAFATAPNETLLTTFDQGLTEQALALPRLLSLALQPPGNAPLALRRVLTELERLLPTKIKAAVDAQTVGRAAQAAKELSMLESTEDVARELFSCLGA